MHTHTHTHTRARARARACTTHTHVPHHTVGGSENPLAGYQRAPTEMPETPPSEVKVLQRHLPRPLPGIRTPAPYDIPGCLDAAESCGGKQKQTKNTDL